MGAPWPDKAPFLGSFALVDPTRSPQSEEDTSADPHRGSMRPESAWPAALPAPKPESASCASPPQAQYGPGCWIPPQPAVPSEACSVTPVSRSQMSQSFCIWALSLIFLPTPRATGAPSVIHRG